MFEQRQTGMSQRYSICVCQTQNLDSLLDLPKIWEGWKKSWNLE